MGRHFQCTDEIIVVSKGKEDIGKVPALGNDGKLDPSVIPEIGICDGQNKAVAATAKMTSGIEIVYSATATPLKFDHTIFDTGNFFNGDGKAYINKSGIYIITGAVAFNENEGNVGSRAVAIVRNGSEALAQTISAPNAATAGLVPSISIIAKLVAGDYIDLRANCGNLNPVIIKATVIPDVSRFSIARLGD